MRRSRKSALNKGFTLVEIMIVVLIIGALAAIAVPAFRRARKKSQQTAFINNMRIFGDAAQLYMLTTGQHLEDSSSGALPTGFAEYLSNPQKWTEGTPVGGAWDSEYEDLGWGDGIKSALGVHFNDGSNPGDDYMREIDERYDDGNLLTGQFRKLAADRFYYILEQQ